MASSPAVSVATVNHFCASGLWAFNMAAARVAAGDEIMVAGGVESMSRVPMASDQPPFLCDPETVGRLNTPPMGVSADAIATVHGIRREEVEAYAVQSQGRAAAARSAGRFSRSLVQVVDSDGRVLLGHDERIRPGASVEKLLSLAPYFAEMGEKWADALVRTRYPQIERSNTCITRATRRPWPTRPWLCSDRPRQPRDSGCVRGRGSSRPPSTRTIP